MKVKGKVKKLVCLYLHLNRANLYDSLLEENWYRLVRKKFLKLGLKR
jgi:hypothetical protein